MKKTILVRLGLVFHVMMVLFVLVPAATADDAGRKEGSLPTADWNAREYDTPLHSHVRTSEMIGREVVNERRETIGTVEDMIIGLEGRLQYLIVARGGVLGIGERLVAVPFDAVEQTGGDEADLMLPRGRELLADAPSFDPVEVWPDFSDPEYRNELQRYFGTRGK